MKKWIIIGGGIQGCTLATFLIKKRKVTIDEVGIIDPHDSPLQHWINCTNKIAMPYLRSPSIHHIDVNPLSLERHAKNTQSGESQLLGHYARPSLELFNQHSLRVLKEIQIEKAWLKGKATGIRKINQAWEVELEDGSIQGEKVALAMGMSGHPIWPDWAVSLKEDGGNIEHIFSEALPPLADLPAEITVVGGGISAAHLSLKLAKKYPGQVTLLSRKPLKVKKFDSDPGWLGPKNMIAFSRLTNYTERRNEIVKARHKGTMTKELYLALKSKQKCGQLKVKYNEVMHAQHVNGMIELRLKNEEILRSSTVILATGFHSTPPSMKWLGPFIEQENLKCASCGFPIVSSASLEWCSNLYVLGGLAELEIGPVSRNISGARRAAERIVNSL